MTEQGDEEEILSSHSQILQLVSHPESRRLLHLIRTQGVKTIAVQSQFSGEGRTFITGLLALGAFYFIKIKVLIVDTVAPVAAQSFFHSLSTHSNESSRIDVALVRTVSQTRIISQVSSLLPHMEGGDSYLSTSDFNTIAYLQSVRNSYDLILIDCPPFDSIRHEDPHPAIIAHHSDSSLIVTSPRSLTQSAVTSLKSLIQRFNLDPIGLVFNGGGRP